MGTGGGLVVIDFSAQGNSANFRREGWSGQELDRVWGIGPRSVLRVALQSFHRSFILEAEIGPCFAPQDITGQIVRLRVNGIAIGWARLKSQSMIRCEIAPDIVREDGIQEIEFGFPGFYRPAWLGVYPDERPLSGWFAFARLYTTDMFRPGPHFPPSHPDVPVIGLLPPVAEPPNAETATAPVTYTFGPDGGGMQYLLNGWRDGGEPIAWIASVSSQIVLPAPAAPGEFLLRLDVEPPIDTDERAVRDVVLTLDRIVIGQFRCDEPTTWIVPLPRELTEGVATLALGFLSAKVASDAPVRGPGLAQIRVMPLPAASSALRTARDGLVAPIAMSRRFPREDAATLPDAIAAALGMDVATLARGFESLGPNAAFAVAQRDLGIHVVNFFRFCEATIADLTRALSDDLRAAVDDPVTVRIERRETGDVAVLSAYDLRWPVPGGEDEAALASAYAMQLGYLRRKFFEGLHGGRKIHVLHQQRPIPLGQAVALLLELNRHGRATLLCVEPAADKRQAGEVEALMPGLMRGYLDPGTESDPAAWTRVMANATLLHRVLHPSGVC
jgi:hypothetical protein